MHTTFSVRARVSLCMFSRVYFYVHVCFNVVYSHDFALGPSWLKVAIVATEDKKSLCCSFMVVAERSFQD